MLHSIVFTTVTILFQDITETAAGDIAALFGIDCSSGDTFVTENGQVLSMVKICFLYFMILYDFVLLLDLIV